MRNFVLKRIAFLFIVLRVEGKKIKNYNIALKDKLSPNLVVVFDVF